MNAKPLALLIFTVFYILGAQWLYSNKIAGVCCGSEKASAKTEVANVEEALTFKYQQAIPELGEDYNDYLKNTLLKNKAADNILQITGHYYDGEEAPEGYDNMGLARAEAIRDLLKDNLPAERIDISSRLMTKRDTLTNSTFSGFSHNWRAPLKKEETTIIALDDEITIYFPFNSTVKDKNPQVDQYLEKLAERLKLTKEKITITGHTDNVGEELDNENLGKQRAESIQNILLARGISKDRISIDSKGERQPATSNSTEEGRYRNRRTVLRIIK